MTSRDEISGDKRGDTANTVQVIDCNSIFETPKVDNDAGGKLPPAMLSLITILARQAAREICNPKEGDQS